MPYKQPVLPSPQQGLLTVGLAVLVLYSIAEGFRIARAQAVMEAAASSLWVPIVLRYVPHLAPGRKQFLPI